MENFSESKIICPICDSDTNKSLTNFLEYHLFKCKNCYGEFSWPMKTPLDYDIIDEMPTVENFNRVKEKSLRRNFNYAALLTFLNTIKKGKILDFGSGSGIFLSHAHDLGFDCYGIDVSDNVKILGNDLNFKFFKTDGKNFNLPANWPKLFDVISAVDVIEHVSEPILVGQNIYKHINDGGYFIGSVPNRDRYYYKFFKIIDDFVPKDLGGDNPPYHLTFYRERTIKVFLEKLGFKNYYIFKGGLLWRKNIYIRGKYSKLLSGIIGKLYKNSSKIPLPFIKLMERYGSHLIFIAKKGNGELNVKDLENKIYTKNIPFFVDGDIE